MEMVQRRRLRLLLTDSGSQSILTEGDSLPSIDVELELSETTSAAAWRVLPTIGLSGPVLDCLVDQSGISADEPVQIHAALVELALSPQDWVPPGGWTWTPIDRPAPSIEPGLVHALADRLAELRGDRPVHQLRIPWARPGWYERATVWIEQVLHDAGRPAPTAILQSKHWGISAVMQVDTPGQRLWFKAVADQFVYEPTITAFLHEAVPQLTAPVVAVEEHEAWMLLEDIKGRVVGEDRGLTRAAFESLADLQTALAGRNDDLLAAGCPHRPISELPDRLRSVLVTTSIRDALDLPKQRIDRLIGALTDAVAAVDAIGIPESFVHGDFHPGNAMTSAAGIRLFDWSDAAVSHPLVDVATWASWFEDDPDHVAEIYRTFHDVRSAHFAEPVDALDQQTLAAVAGAYHTISYAGILEGLEPHRRSEHVGGIGEFFTLLDDFTQR